MTEREPYLEPHYSVEVMPIPEDSYEVEENTYAVARADEGRRYMYTGGLYDCKAVVAYTESGHIGAIAHLSVVDELRPAITRYLDAVGAETATLDITVVTGSHFEADDDCDAQSEEGLMYPSLASIVAELKEHGVARVSTDIAPAGDTTRAVALDLISGNIFPVDEDKVINYQKLDSSRNQTIERKLKL